MKKQLTATAWAWKFPDLEGGDEWHLCRWAEPDKERLTKRSRPTPDAVPIRVRIVPVKTKPRRKAKGRAK